MVRGERDRIHDLPEINIKGEAPRWGIFVLAALAAYVLWK